jgi:HEAT repeat protein
MHSTTSCACLWLLWLASAGCTSSERQPDPAAKPEPFVPLPDEEPSSIGFFLKQYDLSLEQWSKLKLSASSPREQRALGALERNLEKDARERQQELVTCLESGPPAQRRVAAAALGFTHDPAVLSALLAGLSDPDPEVVQRALLGLGVLGEPETPLSEIRHRLLRDPDPWTRNNAAFALQSIALAGARGSELAECSRSGLQDSEPGVRAQCASTLGILADVSAIEALSSLIYDEANLVALASATSLARIGRFEPEHKGEVARTLVDALDRVGPDRREHLLGALIWMSDQNLGNEALPWKEWAYKMP